MNETRWPRGLNRVEAATYVGVGKTTFIEKVKSGEFPPAKAVSEGRKIWDREELDMIFMDLPHAK
jgi:predicted DNA-binding transcriptional regulator AlpA